MTPKLKICGMKMNTTEVASLGPDYLGFIFYDQSPRNFEGELPDISSEIKKVGVFVDAGPETLSEKIKTYKLDIVQLHGDELPDYCQALKMTHEVEIWKVFSVGDRFDFNRLLPYEDCIDKFLFDTRGAEKGGNGVTFDWSILKAYTSAKSIILSGGIGLEQIEAVKDLLSDGLPIEVIDVNSKFEIAPGNKDVEALKKLIHELSVND